MIVLTILGYLLLGIGILLVAIIMIPYEYYVTGEKTDEWEVNVIISWLFGGIKLNFRKHSRKRSEFLLTLLGFKKTVKHGDKFKVASDPKKAPDSSYDDAKAVKAKHNSNYRKYLKKAIIKKVLTAIAKLLKHCQPSKLLIHGKYGFDDPSYTGMMCAFTNQLYWLFDKYDFEIHPVFDEEILEGRFLVGGRIWLPYLILVMLGFFITKPIRNILITQLKLKFKGGLHYVR